MPGPGELLVAVLIGLLAILLAVRLVISVSRWVRRTRRPEARSIRVVGVGGGGSNAVDRMVAAGIRGVDFVALNTDAQALRRSRAGTRLRIGNAVTGGLGSGGDPDTGRRAATEDEAWIGRLVAGADLVFVTAGLGGGTGSGGAPVVAAAARGQGALTVAVVTKPFEFEGARRRQIAEEAAADLADQVDALIVVPNDRVSAVLADDASLETAFVAVDDVLLHAVRGIIELITEPGVINLDFADVRSIMTDAGPALIGLGHGSGPDRAIEAARQAVESPLLEADIEGASRILFNVAAPANLRLAEVREAAHVIRQRADPDANIIFGASTLRSATDDVLITLIATGLGGHAQRRPSIAPVRQPLVVPPERAVAPASTPPTASESAPAAKRAARPIKPRSGVEAPAPIAAEAPATSAEPPMIADGSPLSQKADESPEGAPIPAEAPDPPAAAPSIAAFVDDDLDVPSFLRGHGRRASARERPERPA